MKILLIDANPSWLDSRKNGEIKEQVALPIGLMYLSAYLKRRFGEMVEIKLINTIIDKVDVIAELKSFGAEVVGIRSLSMAKDFFYNIVGKIKRDMPAVKIFAGGPFISSEPRKVLVESEVDGIIMGEGEEAFAELISFLLRGQPLNNIKNFGYRQGSEIVINSQRDFIKNVDELPIPDYSLIDVEKYGKVINYGYTVRKQAIILTARGCPFQCKYCFKFMGAQYRPRSPESVFSEIKYLYDKYDIRDFFVVDDTFNIQRERCINILKLIIDSDIKIRLYFTSGLRGDLLDKEIIDLLVRAGTVWISFGVESVNKRIQKLINRTANVAKLKESIDYCCEKNVMVGIFFMIGFPTETPEEATETIRFVEDLKKVTMPYFFGVRYFPGTALYNLAMEHHIITAELRESVYKPFHNIDLVKTPTMSNLEIKKLFMLYMRKIFLNKERLNHALSVQEKYLTPEEMSYVYGSILHRKINSPREALKLFLS